MLCCDVLLNKNNYGDIDGLVQERRNSIANTLELRLSCINPSISLLCLCDLFTRILQPSFTYTGTIVRLSERQWKNSWRFGPLKIYHATTELSKAGTMWVNFGKSCIWAQYIYMNKTFRNYLLKTCVLLTSYGDIELGQHWHRPWLYRQSQYSETWESKCLALIGQ